MNTKLSQLVLIPVLALSAVLLFNPTAFAQGTATGPDTTHFWLGGSDIFVGGPNDIANPLPIPIDLDPNGPPWTKEIFAAPGLIPQNGTVFDIHETIVNVGNEAWTDWHEHILPDANNVVPAVWLNAQVMVNGVVSPIAVLGLGTPNLWIDPIGIPVQPGDTLEIWKSVFYNGSPFTFDPSDPFLVIEEYPTPEPASVALMGMGSLLVLRRFRRGIE